MTTRWPIALLSALLLVTAADARRGWTASWGTAQLIAEGDNALVPARDVTIRQTVRLSAGGDRVRVRVSNAFGTSPLTIGATHVRGESGSMRLAFSGRAAVTIPAGGQVYSDAVALPVAAGADLEVSLYLASAPTPQTGHPGARATAAVAPGDQVDAPVLANATATTRWYVLADIEVAGGGGTVVAIGDSITDGYGVVPDSNTRWPDILAARLRADPATRGIGVVNSGIGGNRVLLDGIGPNLLARFDRDVLARAGVRWAILLEGVNDLGVLTRDAPASADQHAAIVARIIAGYRDMSARAHARGIKLIGGTIMPFAGNGYYHPAAATEADRQAINRFILTGGAFDAVIDFDRVMRDPAHPDRLAPAYDSGDGLHPSAAGYRAMGEAVPLALFGASRPDPRPAIAITFDDIPAHGPLAPGEIRRDVVARIAAALNDAKAPAFGFLNAGFGLDRPDDAAQAIAAWRGAGLPLGNHSYSHGNLETLGAAAFTADVVRNEAVLARAAGAQDWHWFRYPFLSEGSSAATRDAVRASLAAHGYRAAAVTMSFADYDWNPPFVACAAKHDAAAIARLEAGFLADARSAAQASRAKAKAQLGRDIPYVLLMHVGSFDARMLPRLLDQYRDMGFRFVTLAEAQADPYYAAAMDLTLPGPTPSLAGPPATPALAGPPSGLCR